MMTGLTGPAEAVVFVKDVPSRWLWEGGNLTLQPSSHQPVTANLIFPLAFLCAWLLWADLLGRISVLAHSFSSHLCFLWRPGKSLSGRAVSCCQH